jgi:D-xylose 1-dehydrogenase
MAIYPSLEGMPVLITGGGNGIGAAMVELFAEQRARVAFIEIDSVSAERTAKNIEKAVGLRPFYEIADLRDIEAATKAAARLADITGPFRALVNNAGNDEAHRFEDVSVTYWDDRVAVNLRHQFFLAQALAPAMAAAGGGAIVNIGSISWKIGSIGVPVYATLKSAIEGLTKVLARELGQAGIRVNAIVPGWVLTERQLRKRTTNPRKMSDYLNRQCIKQQLEPRDIAEMALWLCANESIRCTAQMFVVDAGVS